MPPLKSKDVCIVTGGSGGNGLGIVKALLSAGYRVITVDVSRFSESLDVFHYIGDVSDQVLMNEIFDKALSLNPSKLCLVNNAGISIGSDKDPVERWQKTIEINLTAPFNWCQQYAELVRKKSFPRGAIINIGSLATIMGFPDNPSYQAAKSGVMGLTRAFAYDLGEYGITVNCISPGYIPTNMTKNSFDDPVKNKQRAMHTLLGRWGSADDIGNAAVFLCSNEAAYITGINLPVDGGWSVKGLI